MKKIASCFLLSCILLISGCQEKQNVSSYDLDVIYKEIMHTEFENGKLLNLNYEQLENNCLYIKGQGADDQELLNDGVNHKQRTLIYEIGTNGKAYITISEIDQVTEKKELLSMYIYYLEKSFSENQSPDPLWSYNYQLNNLLINVVITGDENLEDKVGFIEEFADQIYKE